MCSVVFEWKMYNDVYTLKVVQGKIKTLCGLLVITQKHFVQGEMWYKNFEMMMHIKVKYDTLH